MKSASATSVMKRLLPSIFTLLIIGLLAACNGGPYNIKDKQTQDIAANAPHAFKFPVVPASPAIQKCLPNAHGEAAIIPDSLNDTMTFQVSGLAPKQKYTLFVTQTPNKPFGISWYQGDILTDTHGAGSVIVRGIFDANTFSVSPGGTTTFAPTNQYHLGLWFSDPQTPFTLGCEPGAQEPMVTPFNGVHHAGILALNTSNFPDNAGPLSKVQSASLDATQVQNQVRGIGTKVLSFPVVPASPAVQKCLPNARGETTIFSDGLNQTLQFQVSGLAPKQKYTLFVTQTPNKPFGISWYQGALVTDSKGNGDVVVRGILDVKTFSVSPGGTTTFAPTNQYHLGLWFSDPQLPSLWAASQERKSLW